MVRNSHGLTKLLIKLISLFMHIKGQKLYYDGVESRIKIRIESTSMNQPNNKMSHKYSKVKSGKRKRACIMLPTFEQKDFFHPSLIKKYIS